MEKIIHCCWFGGNKKSKLIEECMASWRKYLPEYKIIEWNESNFDINSNQYVKEAYENKKWAFVSDYVRLFALNKYGGIYLDTDVEVFRNMDEFLEHDFFSGFEFYSNTLSPITAVMGSKKNSHFISELLSEYDNACFINKDGSLNLQTNTRRITDILVNIYNIDPNKDVYQSSSDKIHIYPSTYFCNKAENSYSIHHFDGSWIPKKQKLRKKILKFIGKFS
ncbi:glycosyltransferase family 32 protein [Shewanella baltica]|uniref:glycosyltransferase family 32 protein n=1 Tax=Shewanella baltica TaxID=62322 RepID=UPI003D7AD592